MTVDLEKRGSPTEPSTEYSIKEGNVQADVFGDEEDHDIRYKTLSWQVSRIIIHPIRSSGPQLTLISVRERLDDC